MQYVHVKRWIFLYLFQYETNKLWTDLRPIWILVPFRLDITVEEYNKLVDRSNRTCIAIFHEL